MLSVNRMKLVWTAVIAAALVGCADDRVVAQSQVRKDAAASLVPVTSGPSDLWPNIWHTP